MTIDVFGETVFTLAEAAKRLPHVRGGRKVHVCCLYRWAMAGRKSRDGMIVRLETIKFGGTTCTSKEALQRFFDRLTGDLTVVTPPTITARERLRQIEAAERRLKQYGI
jgi:hypothetical protein